jgi:hypothetical protein
VSKANALRDATKYLRSATFWPETRAAVNVVLDELERQRNKIADLRGEVERMRRERDHAQARVVREGESTCKPGLHVPAVREGE